MEKETMLCTNEVLKNGDKDFVGGNDQEVAAYSALLSARSPWSYPVLIPKGSTATFLRRHPVRPCPQKINPFVATFGFCRITQDHMKLNILIGLKNTRLTLAFRAAGSCCSLTWSVAVPPKSHIYACGLIGISLDP